MNPLDDVPRGGWLAQYLAALNRRERILLLTTLLVGGFWGWHEGVWRPWEKARNTLEAQHNQLTQNLTILSQQLEQAEKNSALDPGEGAKSDLRLKAWRHRDERAFSGLLPPGMAVAVMETLLQKGRGVQLLDVSTLEPKGVDYGEKQMESAPSRIEEGEARMGGHSQNHLQPTDSDQKNSTDALEKAVSPSDVGRDLNGVKPRLYRHDISLRLMGNYHEIISYLKEIEQSDVPLYWDDMDYNVVNYPLAEVQLHVFTLSFDKYIYKLQ